MKKSVFNESTKNRAGLMFSSEDARNRSINSPLGFVSLDMMQASEQARTPARTPVKDTIENKGMTTYTDAGVSKFTDSNLSGQTQANTKAGEFDKYGTYRTYQLQDLNNQIGTFGGSPVEGFKYFDRTPKIQEMAFKKQKGESYSDTLRRQTNVASSNSTGYDAAQGRVTGGRAYIDRIASLQGVDMNKINSRFDAIGESSMDRWAGLDPNSAQTVNTLYGTSDYNAFNY